VRNYLLVSNAAPACIFLHIKVSLEPFEHDYMNCRNF